MVRKTRLKLSNFKNTKIKKQGVKKSSFKSSNDFNKSNNDSNIKLRNIKTIPLSDLQNLNRRSGFFFFSQDTTRFFRSRYPDEAIIKGNDAFFITSEKFVSSDGTSQPRKFTIRKANLSTGDVDTVGEFQQFSSKSQAEKSLNKILGVKFFN